MICNLGNPMSLCHPVALLSNKTDISKRSTIETSGREERDLNKAIQTSDRENKDLNKTTETSERNKRDLNKTTETCANDIQYRPLTEIKNTDL